MHIAITDDEARAIREALDYKAEDLDYRMKQGLDFSEPEDIERVQKTIVLLNDLFMRLGTPEPTYDADGICPRCGNKTTRDAIGIKPNDAIDFAIAILAATKEIAR
jgi:hypothetical protein